MSVPFWRILRGIRPAWWALVLVAATAGVWQRYQVMRTARSIEDTQRRITELTRVRDRLMAENARLESRERIEHIAIVDLGMRPTTRAQMRVLQIDTASAPLAADE